ncbi:MAG TPA: SRPBCC domain-containing protein [Devosia sp.]|nr:SRPBCC domain-containing protein [Devosia sp.]
MDAKRKDTGKRHTSVERASDREVVVRRTINGLARLVFDAWSKPELIMRWWTPKSIGISFVSCEADVRTGGTYRYVFRHPDFDQPMTFFGRYIEVIPNEKIVWTNEEDGDAGSITTLTLEERGEETLLVIRDLYPNKAAADEAVKSGAIGGFGEMFEQLDELLASLS